MFYSQQLSAVIRRVRVHRPDNGGERLPDPALGDWGRAQVVAADVERFDTLDAALGPMDVPLVQLGYGDDGSVRIEAELQPGERLYGAYDADAEGLDRRGEHVHLVNELHPRHRHLMVGECELCSTRGSGSAPLLAIDGGGSNYGELAVPFVVSSRGWGMYVSNVWHDAVLDLGQSRAEVLSFVAPGGEADVYLFGPGSMVQLMSEYVRLTGRQPLPPAWTLGYLQSRFGYESFDHLHGVLDRFGQEQLPVHGVVFDVQWLEDHVNLRWDPTHFPNPAHNLDRIAARGARSIVITEPGTKAGASNHASGVERGAFATGVDGAEFDSQQWYAQRGIDGYREIEPSTGALVNFFREDAGDWWYDQHLQLLEQGIDAWWLDLNEPEDVTSDVVFAPADWPAPRPQLAGEEVRNLFAIAQQRAFARRDRHHSSRRPFMLSRSGSAGSQRYGVSPWTGDVGATWEDLRIQPRLLLTGGVCGIALMGSDAGGFHGDPGPELFARWMQLGAISPVCRAHGNMADREPWSQGSEVCAAIRPSLILRAQLLPSLVTWTWQALRDREPLMRPMLIGPLGTEAGSEAERAYAGDERWHDCTDQFFVGPLLAAPVLVPGATVRSVELPQGQWIDLWSGDCHDGGARIEVPVTLSSLPLFVRRDQALVADPAPLAGRGQAWPPAELEVWSWSGDEPASCLSYLDDGITRMHEQGAYCLQQITVTGTQLDVRRLGGSWPASRIRVAAPHPGVA